MEYYIFYRKKRRTKMNNFSEVDPRIRIHTKIKWIRNTGSRCADLEVANKSKSQSPPLLAKLPLAAISPASTTSPEKSRPRTKGNSVPNCPPTKTEMDKFFYMGTFTMKFRGTKNYNFLFYFFLHLKTFFYYSHTP